MAKANETIKGFRVRCPKCGEWDSMRVEVYDVDRVTCAACDEEVTASEIVEMLEGWKILLRWLETAPIRES